LLKANEQTVKSARLSELVINLQEEKKVLARKHEQMAAMIRQLE